MLKEGGKGGREGEKKRKEKKRKEKKRKEKKRKEKKRKEKKRKEKKRKEKKRKEKKRIFLWIMKKKKKLTWPKNKPTPNFTSFVWESLK